MVNARITLDGNSTFKNVPIERCTEESLPSDPRVYSYFLTAGRSPISDLYCIQREYDEKFKVSGAFDAPVYEFIDINIQACRNSSDPTATVCKPIEEIKAALSGYFAVFYLDYLMDPDNFENPGTPVGKDYFSPISVGVTRDTNRYYATTRVISDDGFLFTTKNEYLYPTVKLDKETFLIDSTESGQLVHFRMRKHHNEQVYNRRYKKVQNVMSEMGGFIQILYLIFLVITYPYVYKNYYEKIINTIYNFEIAEGGGDSSTNLRKNSSQVHSKYLSRDADENPKSKKKISTLEPLQHMFVSNANDNGKLELKKTLNRNMSTTMKKNERLMKYMLKLQNKPPLKTSFYRFLVGSFKSFFFKNSDLDEEFKYRQLEVGRDAISEKLDISYILKKFYEIDKLKMILLDKNQYHLFEYLPKPVIKKNYKIDLSYNNSTERNEQSKALKFIAHEKNVFSKAKKLYAAYNNIMSKEEISEMDRKLIDLLDDNVKTLLKVLFYLMKCFYY